MILSALFFFIISAQAQFSTSGSGASKKKPDQSSSKSSRQSDIYLLEQKVKTIEQDVLSGNLSVFNKHKSEVLEIMDREISRSAYDFADMKNDLKGIDPDSQEGRSMRISIQQMEGRVNKQKYIRSKVSVFSSDNISIENSRELTGLKSQYYQFIQSMKVNLKNFPDEGSQSGGTSGKPGSSTSTSSGSGSNAFLMSSSASSAEKKQETPEGDSRLSDQKVAENYARTKKSTAVALSGTAKEMQAILENDNTQGLSKLIFELKERMESDIATDKSIAGQLDRGELEYSGLDVASIKNKTTKKEALLRKTKAIELPGQKNQLFDLINDYNRLLK